MVGPRTEAIEPNDGQELIDVIAFLMHYFMEPKYFVKNVAKVVRLGPFAHRSLV